MKTYDVSVSFGSVSADSPLDAAKTVATWLLEYADGFIYDVKDEDSKEAFTVDLAEGDEDAVLPNNKNEQK